MSVRAPLSAVLAFVATLVVACSSAAPGQERPSLPRPTDASLSTPAHPPSPGAPTQPTTAPAGTRRPGDHPAPSADPTDASMPDPSDRPTRPPRPQPTTVPTVDPTLQPTGGPATEATAHKLPAVDLRLQLPGGWIGAEADDLDSLDEIPAVADALDEIEGSVLVFAGADVRGVDGSPVGDNLTVYDLGASVPAVALEVGAGVIAASLETVPEVESDVKVTMVNLPIGQAARLRFTYASEVELTVEAYAFNADSHLVLAAFTAPASQADSARSVFATIADAFREL